jgi:hypothetical protein
VIPHRRHCEEEDDEAIQISFSALDCFASLAMTEQASTTENVRGSALVARMSVSGIRVHTRTT